MLFSCIFMRIEATPCIYTLPETNISRENGWLEDYVPFGARPIFRGELLVLGRVYIYSRFSKRDYIGVSKNTGTPKSSILIGFSIINHPFWGTPSFGNIHVII